MANIYDPDHDGELLLIEEARERLFTKHKITLRPQRLADLRSYGGGPEFIKPSQRDVRYPCALLDAWAEKRNSKPILTFVPVNPARKCDPTKLPKTGD